MQGKSSLFNFILILGWIVVLFPPRTLSHENMARPNSFRVRLEPSRQGSRLILEFRQPVRAQMTAEDGKWLVFLGEQPFHSPRPHYEFDNRYLRALEFDDSKGVPRLILTPGAAGLTHHSLLSNSGKILVIDILGNEPANQAQVSAPPRVSTGSRIRNLPGSLNPDAPQTRLPAVILDPGHGGKDRGARSREGFTEKEWTWEFTHQLRLQLLATGKYHVVLTRGEQEHRTLDQRQIAANTNRALLFLSFHSGDTGLGSRTVVPYIYQSSFREMPSAGQAALGLIPWDQVQERHLSGSLRLGRFLETEFRQIEGFATRKPARVPFRLLQSIDAPAVAIEIGNLSPAENSRHLRNPLFIHQLTQAVVRAIAKFTS